MLRDVWPSLYVWYFLGLCSSPSWLIALLEMEFVKENTRLVRLAIIFSWSVCNAVVNVIFLSVLRSTRTANFFRGYERVGKTIGFVVLLFGNVGLYYYSNKSIACMLAFLFLSFYFLCILFYIQPYTDFGILDFLLTASVNQALSLHGLNHIYSWLVLIACTVIAGLRYRLEPELQSPREAEVQLSRFHGGWTSFSDVVSKTPPITIAESENGGTTDANPSARSTIRDRLRKMKETEYGVNMVSLVPGTGRDLQRYNKGQRLVVGCIPYRFKFGSEGTNSDELEVLLISSLNRQGKLFPKGGWKLDESVQEAASRKGHEEAGVLGNVESELGRWIFKSKSRGLDYEGYMFPLLVTEQLDLWPQKKIRQRVWVSVPEAREVCQYWWMREALDILVNRLTSLSLPKEE